MGLGRRVSVYVRYLRKPTSFSAGFKTNDRMAAIQYCSLIFATTSLIAVAVFLTLTSACYGLAALRGQEFTGSATLGGTGIARQIL